MKNYFLNTQASKKNEHFVHLANCTLLPELTKRRFLGRFKSCNDAMVQARRDYMNAICCPFCLKEPKGIKKENVSKNH